MRLWLRGVQFYTFGPEMLPSALSIPFHSVLFNIVNGKFQGSSILISLLRWIHIICRRWYFCHLLVESLKNLWRIFATFTKLSPYWNWDTCPKNFTNCRFGGGHQSIQSKLRNSKKWCECEVHGSLLSSGARPAPSAHCTPILLRVLVNVKCY